MATNSNEEIIEKRATAPIATSCLVIACVALMGAIIFQIVEIAAYRTGVAEPARINQGIAQDKAAKYMSQLKKDVEAVEALTPSGSGGLGAGAGLEGDSFGTAPPTMPEEPIEEPEEDPSAEE